MFYAMLVLKIIWMIMCLKSQRIMIENFIQFSSIAQSLFELKCFCYFLINKNLPMLKGFISSLVCMCWRVFVQHKCTLVSEVRVLLPLKVFSLLPNTSISFIHYQLLLIIWLMNKEG